MTIKEAINEAKLMFNWNIVPHEPTSVRVIFNEYKKEKGKIQDIKFDLYTDDLEQELAELWEDLFEELGSKRDGVKSVEAYGYILD